MTQLKPAKLPPRRAPSGTHTAEEMAPPKPVLPAYRYYSTPPEWVSLTLGDIASGIPQEHRTPQWSDAFVATLPCESVFNSAVPKISLSRLAELFPDWITAGDSPASVPLPIAKIVQSYALVEHAERLPDPEPEPLPEPEVAPEPEPVEAFAPEPEIAPEPELVEAFAPEPEVALAPEPVAAIEPEPETTPEPPAPEAVLPVEETPVFVAPEIPAEENFLPPPPPEPVEEPAPVEEAPVAEAEPEPLPEPPAEIMPRPVIQARPYVEAKPLPKRPSLFSGLPLFRRKALTPATPLPPRIPASLPPIPPPRPLPTGIIPPASPVFVRRPPVEEPLQAPIVGNIPPVPPSEPVAETPFIAPEEPFIPEAAVEVPAPEPEPATEIPVAVVETEHLAPQQMPQNDDSQEHLQALFMTEEHLTVQRVVELCGTLPGVKSCILARRGTVIASFNVPSNIDPVSLSTHGIEMLQAMRDSSMLMGLGSIPTVTIHSEKGPVSFLQHDALCLLVLHRDRAFVPGVREKLSDVLSEIMRANLLLPVSGQPEPQN